MEPKISCLLPGPGAEILSCLESLPFFFLSLPPYPHLSLPLSVPLKLRPNCPPFSI